MPIKSITSEIKKLIMQYPYYENVRKDVLDLVKKRSYKKILEVGGGEFPTLFSLGAAYGAEIWGVDIYDCRKEGLKFIKGSVEDPTIQSQLPDEAFDLIVANDVLEHLVDPEGAMRFLRKKLNKDGVCVLSIPNIRQLRAFFYIYIRGTFPRTESGLFDRTHLRWFCKKDVIQLAFENGFRVEKVSSSGRLVPKILESSWVAEFLALQNLFLLMKSDD